MANTPAQGDPRTLALSEAVQSITGWDAGYARAYASAVVYEYTNGRAHFYAHLYARNHARDHASYCASYYGGADAHVHARATDEQQALIAAVHALLFG